MMSSSVTISSKHALVPAAQATSIRLFMGFFIFQGRGKACTGEKQLSRLSTAAAPCSNTLPCFSKQRGVHRFSTNQSGSQKRNPQSALRLLITAWWNLNRRLSDSCLLPFTRVASCNAAQQSSAELITFISIN